ncbi:MAG: hypothetical protein VW405_04980 [Rhodospirillaceae bacterium]
MTAGATVTLTDIEQRLARVLAAERTRVNRAAQITNLQVSPDRAEQVELTGVGAELAWCRLANVYPDLTLSPRRGGADALWAGRAVDVKGTERPGGQLLAHPTKLRRDGVEVYALMTGPWPTYTFRGLASSDQLLQADRLVDLGYGPTYAMAQEALRA